MRKGEGQGRKWTQKRIRIRKDRSNKGDKDREEARKRQDRKEI